MVLDFSLDLKQVGFFFVRNCVIEYFFNIELFADVMSPLYYFQYKKKKKTNVKTPKICSTAKKRKFRSL